MIDVFLTGHTSRIVKGIQTVIVTIQLGVTESVVVEPVPLSLVWQINNSLVASMPVEPDHLFVYRSPTVKRGSMDELRLGS